MPQECDLSVLTPPRVPYSFRMHANILLLIFLSAKWQPQRKTSIPRSRSTPFDPLYDELFRSEVNLIWFYLWLVRFDNCVYFAVFVWWRNQCDHRIYHKRYGKVYYASARKGRSQRECYHVCFLKTHSLLFFFASTITRNLRHRWSCAPFRSNYYLRRHHKIHLQVRNRYIYSVPILRYN